MGAFCGQSLARQGFSKEIEAVLAAETPRFRGAVPLDADEPRDPLRRHRGR